MFSLWWEIDLCSGWFSDLRAPLTFVTYLLLVVGKLEENGFAERVMCSIKEQAALADYATFADAQAQTGHFLDTVYHHKRIHSSLGYLTPAGFHQ